MAKFDETAKATGRHGVVSEFVYFLKATKKWWLLPIVVASAVPDAASQALLKVLTGMGADAEGQQRLRLLGLDGLVPIADAQRTELRK